MIEHEHVHEHSHGHPHVHGHVHDPEQTKKISNRLARAIGHLESIKKMVEDDRNCSEVLIQLAAAFLTTMVDSSVFRKPFGLFLLYAGLSILFEKKKNSKKETP